MGLCGDARDAAQTARTWAKTIISRAGGPDPGRGHGPRSSSALGGEGMMAFWYHFAILFERCSSLTAVDAGTRVGRFMMQDLLGTFIALMHRPDPSGQPGGHLPVAWPAGGYFLYQGVVDPWGHQHPVAAVRIANQMLAGLAGVRQVVLVEDQARSLPVGDLLPTLAGYCAR